MISPAAFIDLLTPRSGQAPAFRLGTIPSDYTSGRPRVRFDGEAAAGSRTFPYLASYTPAPDDRVLVALVGHGGVVLGKIV